jgi:16S rRNA processing protein RimM
VTKSVSAGSSDPTDTTAVDSANSSPTPDLLEVGRIGKSHGLRGEVSVVWSTNMVEERSTPGTKLKADDVWFTVVAARPHQDRWLVTFDGVEGRDQADQLRGRVLYAEPIESEDDVFVHELIGRELIDQHGAQHGQVIAIVANPASDLIELSDGHLVPLAFYQSHDHAQVVVDVPAGLLDDDSL